MTRVRNLTTRRHFLALAASAALLASTGCGPSPPPGSVRPAGSTSPIPDSTPTPGRLLGLFPAPPQPTMTPTPPPVVLRFAHWEVNAAGGALADLCEWFTRATPNTIVRPEVRSFGAHFQQLPESVAAGNPPDVFVTSGAYVDQQRQAMALLDVGDRAAADRLDLRRFWSEPIVRPDNGHLFSLPLWAAVDVVFLNLDILGRAGVALPSDKWTWSTLLNAARLATVGKPGEVTRWGLLLINDVQGGWGSFVFSGGGRWLDPTGSQVAFDQPARDALQWLTDAMVVHHVAPTPSEQQALTRGGTIDPFLNGDVAIFPTGTWEMPRALERAKFRWDIAPVPRPSETGHNAAISSVQPGSLARSGQHLDESWRFLSFMLEKDQQQRLASAKLFLPASKDVATDASTGYASKPPDQVSTALSAMATARDLQFSTTWQELRSAAIATIEPAFDGQVSLDDALTIARPGGNLTPTVTASTASVN